MFTCIKCGIEKPSTHFHKDKSARRGHRSTCSDCNREAVREWRKQNPERASAITAKWIEENPVQYARGRRNTWLTRKYGMSVDEFEQRLAAQANRCPMCDEEFVIQAHVDHAHDTGTIRDLLCSSCNRKFGWFEKNRERILTYDRKWHGK